MNRFLHIIQTDKPSAAWEEAYPIGNGRLGAMIFGNPASELLQMNEDTLWSGVPRNESSDTFYADYMETRKMIDEGKYGEATEFATRLGVGDSETYEPAGDLHIDFSGIDK